MAPVFERTSVTSDYCCSQVAYARPHCRAILHSLLLVVMYCGFTRCIPGIRYRYSVAVSAVWFILPEPEGRSPEGEGLYRAVSLTYVTS